MFINYMEKYSTKLLSISSVTHSDYTSNEIFKVINPKIYYAVEHSLKEAEKYRETNIQNKLILLFQCI